MELEAQDSSLSTHPTISLYINYKELRPDILPLLNTIHPFKVYAVLIIVTGRATVTAS